MRQPVRIKETAPVRALTRKGLQLGKDLVAFDLYVSVLNSR